MVGEYNEEEKDEGQGDGRGEEAGRPPKNRILASTQLETNLNQLWLLIPQMKLGS
jgi:hypothetical protein